MTHSAAFVDTSVFIARVAHSEAMKARVEHFLASLDEVVSGLVVVQEFKRRLLHEAAYILGLLKRYASYRLAVRHVQQMLPPQQARKKNLSLDLLLADFPDASDAEMTERATRSLRILLVSGLADLRASVDTWVQDSGCACGHRQIRELRSGTWDFGHSKCSKMKGVCKIADFFASRKPEAQRIYSFLREAPAPGKTREIQEVESLLANYFAGAC